MFQPTKAEKISDEIYHKLLEQSKIRFNIIHLPKRKSQLSMERHDYFQEEKVLDALRKGKFRKWVNTPKL